MEDSFELPVTYKGKELLFPAELLQLGYTYKIQVDIYGQIVFFEPDEERNFRAMLDPAEEGAKPVDTALLQAIIDAIEGLVK